jgi:hypothetical protein
VLGALVVLLTAGIVVVNVPGRSGPSAPLPRADAPPATVARAFLDAAVRRDCGSMRALSTPDDTNWCPASLWTQWTGEGDPTMHSWTTLQSVSDRNDPEQCYQYGLDQDGLVGMASGANTWGLCLRRGNDGWRVTSEGVG